METKDRNWIASKYGTDFAQAIGRMSDKDFSAAFKVSVSHIYLIRKRAGIPSFRELCTTSVEDFVEKISKKYGAEFIGSLGLETDYAIAERYGIDRGRVSRIRQRFGIRPFQESNPQGTNRSAERLVVVFTEISIAEATEEYAVGLFLAELRERKAAIQPTKA